MLRRKRLMHLCGIIFLFTTYNISSVTSFHVLATEVVKDKNMEMVDKDGSKLINNSAEVQYEQGKNESDRLSVEKLKQEEIIKAEKFKQEEIERQKNKPQLQEFILTFYTSLTSENSSAGAVTCQNKPLSRGGVANNVIPQNTNIYLEGYGQVIVNDKGSSKYFSESNRLDVFIEREEGESDKQYLRRVNNYGVQKVQGYILLST
jgi:3D (Asp-Asp-Asp) domain-containing protein